MINILYGLNIEKIALDLTLNHAEIKMNIIQNSIYGVDIEQGAVDIARLRFWLSLVVEENGAGSQTATTVTTPEIEKAKEHINGKAQLNTVEQVSKPVVSTLSQPLSDSALEVTYDKTVHIIFPSAVKYVDLGSMDIIAGKADGAENVVRVKSAVENFKEETNLSVITENGNFYTFNVKYAKEPLLLNVEMVDFIHDGDKVNRPNNALDIYLTELGNESPKLVHLIMKSIHKDNDRKVKHIGSKRFGVQYLYHQTCSLFF